MKKVVREFQSTSNTLSNGIHGIKLSKLKIFHQFFSKYHTPPRHAGGGPENSGKWIFFNQDPIITL